jgi:hypothetical protein
MGFWAAWEWFIWLASGEWMLHFRPNGGDVIFLRSIQVAVLFFFSALLVIAKLDPKFTLSGPEIAEKLHWFGAILTASYFSLYARFQQQWSYLAAV